MLMTPPPGYSTTGYSPATINRQSTQRLGMPGIQGAGITGTKPSSGAFTPTVPGLSSNPLSGMSVKPLGEQQQNTAALLKLLGRV